MVDTRRYVTPTGSDLNLALNIAAAQRGAVVLPDAVPDADFSSALPTRRARRDQERLMGYANVFNEYGGNLPGNTETSTRSEPRTLRAGLGDHGASCRPTYRGLNIYFHYSARFSREDRDAMLEAARASVLKGPITLYDQHHHNVRFHDGRPETDGS